MRRTIVLAVLAVGSYLTFVGCHHFDGRQDQPCPGPGPAPGPVFDPGFSPLPKGNQWLPEPPVPPAPIGIQTVPPAPIGIQSKSIDPFAYQKGLPGQAPLGPSVRLYPPEVAESTEADKKTQLYPPNPLVPEKPAPPKVEEAVKPMEPAKLFPVGIPQFVQVRDKVANGQRPSLDDGLDWLRNNGYKTVLFIHEPGSSESADRKQVEKRGMKFIALELSPATLSRKKIEEFDRIVGESALFPLFVYDRDGSLAGGLWYLHFRLTRQLSDEAARGKARPLGLREDAEGSYREMWQAAQKLVNSAS